MGKLKHSGSDVTRKYKTPSIHGGFTIFYDALATNIAFKELSGNQKSLLLCMYLQEYGKNKPSGRDKPEHFNFNQQLWCDKYGLYKANNRDGFTRDRDVLIEKGFIKCIKDGSSTRTKSIYAFSDMYKKYGSPEFCVSAKDRTMTGNKKFRAANKIASFEEECRP